MRQVSVQKIRDVIEQLCITANTEMRRDIKKALIAAARAEKKDRAKQILGAILHNAEIAKTQGLAICQDTGMVGVYLKKGDGVSIVGGDLIEAVNAGVRAAYQKASFRPSVVADPLVRTNTGDNTPAILDITYTRGAKITVTVSIKGFGSENKSRAMMFAPTSSAEDIKRFIVEAVREAGADACPPFIVGVGIGGTFDKAASMAREATTRPIDRKNPIAHLAQLEDELRDGINALGIGPMGLGGTSTALGVNVLSHSTHIAGLPVAVNIGCHATRSATKII